MKYIGRLVLLLSILSVFQQGEILAQSKEDLHPCGTPNFKTDFLIKYQDKAYSYARKAEDTVIYLPITIHLVGTDAGSGYYKPQFVYESLCQVNEDYQDAKIQFFIEGEFNYIDNDSYYVHSSVLEGADMMFENNVPNTINCYVVSDPAGNCGYNLPYAGVALSTSCLGYGEKTWSHELGHALSVQHPFLGWEGNIYQSGTNAPEKLVYNYTYFKDTLIRDTVILDTTYSELVDRSNCEVAADRNCDTPNDFIARRWTCDSDGMSPNVMYDYNGVEFRSDGSLIMAYSNDECQTRFSNDEVDQMRANIFEEKADYLYDQSEPLIIEGIDFGLSPNNNETVEVNEVILSWNAIEKAEEYLITVGLGPNMANRGYYNTRDTSIDISDYQFFLNAPYYYEVFPVNSKYFCGPRDKGNFTPVMSSGIAEEPDIIIGANVFSRNEKIYLRNNEVQSLDYVLWSSNGREVSAGLLVPGHRQAIKAPDYPGLYLLQITDGNRNRWDKIIVQ